MRKLCEEFKHFRGQPVEIVCPDNHFIGLVADCDETSVLVIDDCGRTV